ncbi:MAG: S-layer homology domain-containing protein [Clostridia bacterium]|nr:S-layer homology domain-containing protein [Clostridia bacterium]
MKKKLILLLVMSMFGIVGANAAELNVSVSITEEGNDTVELITNHDGMDLKWISAYVEDENGNPVWIGEKRPTDDENLKFYFTSSDIKTRNYKAVVSFTKKDNSVTKLEKDFTYYTYDEVQTAIRQVLNKEKNLKEIKDILGLQFNLLYETVNNDSLIVDEMNLILQDKVNVTQSDFLIAFDAALIKAALKDRSSETVEFILTNYADTVGITDEMQEKKWYNEISSKSNIISRMAQSEYNNFDEFREAFRAQVFIEKVNTQHSSKIISFLREHHDNSYKYNDGKVFSLDFSEFDKELTTAAKKEYAGVLLAQSSYDKSSLEALKISFDSAIADAAKYKPPTSGGSSSGGSSSGGGGFSYTVENDAVNSYTNEKNNKFLDLSEAEWARKEIEYCVEKGIVKGKSENMFYPNDLITREEFTALIVRAFEVKASGEADFNDVDKNQWYYGSIKAAYSSGIIKGQGDIFGIGDNITRQDMAVIMYRVAKNNGLDLGAKSERKLSDIDSCSDYAREAIDTMYKANYINGVSEGIYQPMDNATRAQAVKIIYNLIKK